MNKEKTMQTYRFTMTCGHTREVQADEPPSSKTPHCYECREATGKKVQKPMQSLQVKDGKKWTDLPLPELAERKARTGKVAKRSARAARVPTVIAALDEARQLRDAKKNGKPAPATPNLDAVNAAHGIATVNGTPVEEPTTDTAVSAQVPEVTPRRVTRKGSPAKGTTKDTATTTKARATKAPAKKTTARKAPSTKKVTRKSA